MQCRLYYSDTLQTVVMLKFHFHFPFASAGELCCCFIMSSFYYCPSGVFITPLPKIKQEKRKKKREKINKKSGRNNDKKQQEDKRQPSAYEQSID